MLTTAWKLDVVAPITWTAIEHFGVVHAYLCIYPFILDSATID